MNEKVMNLYRNRVDELAIRKTIEQSICIAGPDVETQQNHESKYKIRILRNNREIIFSSNENSLIDQIDKQLEIIDTLPKDQFQNTFQTISGEFHNNHDSHVSDDVLREYFNYLQKYEKNDKFFKLDDFSLSSDKENSYFLNNYGLYIENTNKSSYISCSMVVGDHKEMQSDYDFSYLKANWLSKEFNIEYFLNNLYERVKNKFNSTSIETKSYSCIIESKLVASLIKIMVGSLTGNNIVSKQSFLINETENLGSFSIRENPFYGPRSIDKTNNMQVDELGLELKNKFLINNGKVENYIIGRLNSNKLNLPISANNFDFSEYFTNIEFLPNNVEESLLNKMQDGLLITDFLGSNVNYSNGNYTSSATGLIIENGKVKGSFCNAVVSFNIKEIFSNAIFENNITEHYGIFCSSMLVEKIQISC
jgi:PmbA protein